MTKQPELFALFCDDVRHEIGGTQSLIGVFQDMVMLDKLPSTFPRLSVFFNLHLYDINFDRIVIELSEEGTNEILATIEMDDIEGVKRRLQDNEVPISEMGVKVNGTIGVSPLVLETLTTFQLCARLAESRLVRSSAKLTFRLPQPQTT